MTRETERAADVLQILRKHCGCFAFSIAGSYYQRRGMPDSCIIKGGKHFWVEFKGRTTKIEELQYATLREMRKFGAHCTIVRFLEPRRWLINEFETIEFESLGEGVRKLLEWLEKDYASVQTTTIVREHPE